MLYNGFGGTLCFKSIKFAELQLTLFGQLSLLFFGDDQQKRLLNNVVKCICEC